MTNKIKFKLSECVRAREGARVRAFPGVLSVCELWPWTHVLGTIPTEIILQNMF